MAYNGHLPPLASHHLCSVCVCVYANLLLWRETALPYCNRVCACDLILLPSLEVLSPESLWKVELKYKFILVTIFFLKKLFENVGLVLQHINFKWTVWFTTVLF